MDGCLGDSECLDGMICLPRVWADLSQIMGACAYPLNGNPTGAPCDDDGCDHGICFNGSYCSQLCVDSDDCPAGMPCTGGTMYMGSLGAFPGTMVCTL